MAILSGVTIQIAAMPGYSPLDRFDIAMGLTNSSYQIDGRLLPTIVVNSDTGISATQFSPPFTHRSISPFELDPSHNLVVEFDQLSSSYRDGGRIILAQAQSAASIALKSFTVGSLPVFGSADTQIVSHVPFLMFNVSYACEWMWSFVVPIAMGLI